MKWISCCLYLAVLAVSCSCRQEGNADAVHRSVEQTPDSVLESNFFERSDTVVFAGYMRENDSSALVPFTIRLDGGSQHLWVETPRDTLFYDRASLEDFSPLPRQRGISLRFHFRFGYGVADFARNVIRLHRGKLGVSLVYCDSAWVYEDFSGSSGPDSPAWVNTDHDTNQGGLTSRIEISSDASQIRVHQEDTIYLRDGSLLQRGYRIRNHVHRKTLAFVYNDSLGVYVDEEAVAGRPVSLKFCNDCYESMEGETPPTEVLHYDFLSYKIVFGAGRWFRLDDEGCLCKEHMALVPYRGVSSP